MFNYLSDITLNVMHYLKTHRPFGTPVQKPVPNYENEPALDALLDRYPTQIRKWLEFQYDCASARR